MRKKSKNNNLIKVSGGLAIMFSVFLLLAISLQLTKNNSAYTRIVNDSANNIPTATKAPNENMNQGTFDLKSDGDIIQQIDTATSYHYRAISADKLKNDNANPVLKLEIIDGGNKKWDQVKWNWLDTKNGSLFFHFKTTKNGQTEMLKNYTGKYQLIF